MLALATRDGYVAASLPGLAHVARVSREEAEQAIKTLSAPDPDSRSHEYDGRRIAAVDGGWTILNYAKVRDEWTMDDRREYQRQWIHNKRMSTSAVDVCLHVDNVEAPTPTPSPSKDIAPDGAKKRDLTWDALLQACGIPLTAEIPSSARGAYNKACKDLKAIGATPEQIEAHAAAYRRKWSTELTPTALVRRWNECVAPRRSVRHAM